ncbi:hypothetical protein DIPPA_35311 [Diplonema papillatum]|nr:hypothetical protein DIPPA_35311 [Diplonema papillatum]
MTARLLQALVVASWGLFQVGHAQAVLQLVSTADWHRLGGLPQSWDDRDTRLELVVRTDADVTVSLSSRYDRDGATASAFERDELALDPVDGSGEAPAGVPADTLGDANATFYVGSAASERNPDLEISVFADSTATTIVITGLTPCNVHSIGVSYMNASASPPLVRLGLEFSVGPCFEVAAVVPAAVVFGVFFLATAAAGVVYGCLREDIDNVLAAQGTCPDLSAVERDIVGLGGYKFPFAPRPAGADPPRHPADRPPDHEAGGASAFEVQIETVDGETHHYDDGRQQPAAEGNLGGRHSLPAGHDRAPPGNHHPSVGQGPDGQHRDSADHPHPVAANYDQLPPGAVDQRLDADPSLVINYDESPPRAHDPTIDQKVDGHPPQSPEAEYDRPPGSQSLAGYRLEAQPRDGSANAVVAYDGSQNPAGGRKAFGGASQRLCLAAGSYGRMMPGGASSVLGASAATTNERDRLLREHLGSPWAGTREIVVVPSKPGKVLAFALGLAVIAAAVLWGLPLLPLRVVDALTGDPSTAGLWLALLPMSAAVAAAAALPLYFVINFAIAPVAAERGAAGIMKQPAASPANPLDTGVMSQSEGAGVAHEQESSFFVRTNDDGIESLQCLSPLSPASWVDAGFGDAKKSRSQPGAGGMAPGDPGLHGCTLDAVEDFVPEESEQPAAAAAAAGEGAGPAAFEYADAAPSVVLQYSEHAASFKEGLLPAGDFAAENSDQPAAATEGAGPAVIQYADAAPSVVAHYTEHAASTEEGHTPYPRSLAGQVPTERAGPAALEDTDTAPSVVAQYAEHAASFDEGHPSYPPSLAAVAARLRARQRRAEVVQHAAHLMQQNTKAFSAWHSPLPPGSPSWYEPGPDYRGVPGGTAASPVSRIGTHHHSRRTSSLTRDPFSLGDSTADQAIRATAELEAVMKDKLEAQERAYADKLQEQERRFEAKLGGIAVEQEVQKRIFEMYGPGSPASSHARHSHPRESFVSTGSPRARQGNPPMLSGRSESVFLVPPLQKSYLHEARTTRVSFDVPEADGRAAAPLVERTESCVLAACAAPPRPDSGPAASDGGSPRKSPRGSRIASRGSARSEVASPVAAAAAVKRVVVETLLPRSAGRDPLPDVQTAIAEQLFQHPLLHTVHPGITHLTFSRNASKVAFDLHSYMSYNDIRDAFAQTEALAGQPLVGVRVDGVVYPFLKADAAALYLECESVEALPPSFEEKAVVELAAQDMLLAPPWVTDIHASIVDTVAADSFRRESPAVMIRMRLYTRSEFPEVAERLKCLQTLVGLPVLGTSLGAMKRARVLMKMDGDFDHLPAEFSQMMHDVISRNRELRLAYPYVDKVEVSRGSVVAMFWIFTRDEKDEVEEAFQRLRNTYVLGLPVVLVQVGGWLAIDKMDDGNALGLTSWGGSANDDLGQTGFTKDESALKVTFMATAERSEAGRGTVASSGGSPAPPEAAETRSRYVDLAIFAGFAVCEMAAFLVGFSLLSAYDWLGACLVILALAAGVLLAFDLLPAGFFFQYCGVAGVLAVLHLNHGWSLHRCAVIAVLAALFFLAFQSAKMRMPRASAGLLCAGALAYDCYSTGIAADGPIDPVVCSAVGLSFVVYAAAAVYCARKGLLGFDVFVGLVVLHSVALDGLSQYADSGVDALHVFAPLWAGALAVFRLYGVYNPTVTPRWLTVSDVTHGIALCAFSFAWLALHVYVHIEQGRLVSYHGTGVVFVEATAVYFLALAPLSFDALPRLYQPAVVHHRNPVGVFASLRAVLNSLY